MGNNLDTYGGGFAQHVYLHANRIASVWGNDREVLTTDGDESSGNFAAGAARLLSADGTNLTLSCYATHGSGNMRGGMVTIIAGGAAGQIRRIVGFYTGSWSIGGANATCQRSFKLNAPFAVAPDASSVYQALPYTGGSILHRMHYADSGAVQVIPAPAVPKVNRCLHKDPCSCCLRALARCSATARWCRRSSRRWWGSAWEGT